MAIESPISLQQDTISALPLPIRTIVTFVPVAGLGLTQTQQQIVSVADSQGQIQDWQQEFDLLRAILVELRAMRALQSRMFGEPFYQETPAVDFERN